MRRAAGCLAEEAAYYLDLAGGDVNRAIALQKADAAWEEATQLEASARQRASKMALANAMSTRADWARAHAEDTLRGKMQHAARADLAVV